MDRNTVTGLLLIVLLVLGYSIMMRDEPPPKKAAEPAPQAEAPTTPEEAPGDAPKATAAKGKTPATAPEKTETALSQAPTAPPDSLLAAKDSLEKVKRFGDFAPLTEGRGRTIVVETDLARFEVSTAGAQFKSVILKNYTTYGGDPLPVWLGSPYTYWGVLFRPENAPQPISTQDLVYSAKSKGFKVTGEETKSLVLTAALDAQRHIEHRFTFTGNAYDVGYQVRFVNLKQSLIGDLEFEAQSDIPSTEKSRENAQQKTTILYADSELEVEELSVATDEPEAEKSDFDLQWVAFKTHFFSTAFLSEAGFENGRFISAPIPEKYGVQRLRTEGLFLTPEGKAGDAVQLRIYFGPNQYDVLTSYDKNLDELIDMGWGPIGWINIGIHYLFLWLERSIANYGLIIFLLALFVKLLTWPLTRKALKSQEKMRIVNKLPEVKEIEERHKGDPQKLQQEKMKFYSSIGVNPLGGCLPLVLQMPVLLAMFIFFPNAIELRQQAFLWAEDLSSYDAFVTFDFSLPVIGDHLSLFTLLWVVSQLVYTVIQQRAQSGMQAGQPAIMKYFPYIMPLIFFGIFNSYSSGLSYYYLVINLITIGQTYATKAFLIDKQKLIADIHAIAAGDVEPKRSGLMGWAQKQQQKREEILAAQKAQLQGRSGRRQLEQSQKRAQARKKRKKSR